MFNPKRSVVYGGEVLAGKAKKMNSIFKIPFNVSHLKRKIKRISFFQSYYQVPRSFCIEGSLNEN
jgi:hypothetical protein